MEALISVNGGPQVPLSKVKQVLGAVKASAAAARERADGAAESGIAADRLSSIVDRVERLEEERKALGDDIKDIFAEAKSAGFDVTVVRQVVALRRKEPAEVEEQEMLLDLYRRALGL